MRKVNPNDLCDDLVEEINSLQEFYTDTVPVLYRRSKRTSNISLLSELVFFQGCVSVESFLSDWFVGCVNRNPNVYLDFLHRGTRQSAEKRISPGYLKLLDLKKPKHLPLSEIRELLIHKKENITFRDFDKMEEDGRQWLSPKWASRIQRIPSTRRNILDTARAIRHCIAHRSENSFHTMNNAIKDLPSKGVAVKLRWEKKLVVKPGSYLQANKDGKSRVEIFFGEFKEPANDLKVK